MKNIPIGEVLKENGLISEEQLQKGLDAQRLDRSKRLGQHLIDLGFVSERHVLSALSDKLSEPLLDMNSVDIQLDAVAKIPQELAEKYKMVAIAEADGRLQIVTSDPLNFYAIEDIRLVTGMNLFVCLAEKAEIEKIIEYYYSEIKARNVANQTNDQMNVFEFDESALFNSADDDTPVVKLLNSLLMRGYNSNASDIHIEPFMDKTKVRMRIDGQIIDFVNLAKSVHASLIVRIKIMANLDIAEKRLPQDGHVLTTIEGTEMNLRVSIIPTVHGEKAVLRYLNSNTPINHVEHFGMSEDNYHKIAMMMDMPHGILYITGPTGSGKTTTLYMILETLARRNVNISTIEDPVEKNLENINQMQVNTMSGLSFERGLRALLRQDPDIIMVGETRDAQTASISVSAAITGHLVVSTLHTNDAISAIVRLQDMGIEAFMVANSLVGVVAQRLVRKICPHCKQAIVPSSLERLELGDDMNVLYKGSGCHHCNQTGYKGRIAVHEIIFVDKTVRKMIASTCEIEEIYAYMKKHQRISTLKDSAMELVREGVTTLEELRKITCTL